MTAEHCAVIAPCFNEGEVAVRFVRELGANLAERSGRFTMVMVDDGSTDDTVDRLCALGPLAANVDLHVLSLPYNVGHQKAIHQGLLYASELEAQRFIVMDADGEDDPAAITELIGTREASIILVARGSRSGTPWFKIGYWCYRHLFKLLTGRRITFGNYSLIDRRVLGTLLDRGFVHYAAFLSRQPVPSKIITYDRRERIDGRSKMGFTSLSIHAFRSMVEYSEEVLSGFLKAAFLLTVVLVSSILAIVCIKLFTPYAIPGWASTLSLSLFNSVLLCAGFFAIGLLLVNTAQRRENTDRRLYRLVPPRKEVP